MAWAKNASFTATTGIAVLDTDSDVSMTAKKFNQILGHIVAGGVVDLTVRYSGNDNTVYAYRISTNGGADGTAASQDASDIGLGNVANDDFTVGYVCSISGEEKLAIFNTVSRNTAGATNAPTRRENVHKFVPSPDADITSVQLNDGFGNPPTGTDITTDSNVTALGTD